ncbi:MAG: hypothetical protein GXX96_30785 [Planctomycetaceae bacterium]|nr:hypothetical protein [Planctomycetaceae bacterium]
MVSPTLTPPEAPSKLPSDPLVATIDKRIRQTRRQLRFNDFAAGLIALLAGVLGYLFLAAVADHWLVAGGLGFAGRLLLFLGLVVGAGWYCYRVLIPPLAYQVNPIYAAKALEQARPSIKNGLINLLLLRREAKTRHESSLAQRVIESLQATTADEVAKIPAEVAVDRIHLIRRGYLLVAMVALAAFYLVLSPKSPMPSFGRVLWPWARIAAPSRVHIDQVAPGDATVFQGRSVTVSAAVEGLRPGEEVLLLFSTEDGQIVDQAIPLEPGEGHNRFECKLPPSQAGLQQSLLYRLTAGDCTTVDYTLRMEVPPTIVVDSVRYIYPPYTKLPERTVSDAADIRAVEGTRITVQATANRKIQWAGIEMDDAADQRVRMRANGQQALGEFTLKLSGDQSPRWYQIRFAESETGENRENLDPVRHRIEVFPDLAPQVRLVEAPADEAAIPLDGLAEMKIEASDPDFALSRVALLAQRDGRPLAIPLLLDRTDTQSGHEGRFEAVYPFEPAKLRLRVGDEIEYRAVAEDNRQPQRNRTETEPRRLKIGPPERSNPQQSQDPAEGTSPDPQGKPQGQQPGQDPQNPNETGKSEGAEKQPGQNDPNQPAEQGKEGAESQQQPGESGAGEKQDQGGEGKNGEKGESTEQSGQPGQGEKQQDQNQEGPEGEKQDQPFDPENAGEVFEEILKQREKEMQQGGEQPKNGNQPGQNAEPQPKPNEQSESGDNESAGKPQAGEQSEDAKEHEGDSDVPPNRTEQGGEEGGEQGLPSPEGMEGAAGQPGGTSPNDPQNQSSDTPSDSGGGKPTGKPGKGETSPDAETVDGQVKPEDLQNADIESMERQPADPGDGKDPDFSQKPQPGSPQGGESGKTGSTEKPEDARPTPMPQEANQPNAEKPTGSQNVEPKEKSEATSPSQSRKQSDQNQRDPAEGDRSGDGGEGGGQDSDRTGLGNPGSSTPDEEGGQPGGEKGEGETGPGAGDKIPTDQATGNQAKQPGGTGKGDGATGDDTPGEQPQQSPQPSQNQQPGPQQPNDAPGSPSSSDPSQRGATDPKTHQPGGTGETQGPGQGADQPPGPEAANKEYADKATNLALEYLEDQLNKTDPNQELLDRLGWTRQDLERFLRRWQEMKAAAKETGSTGEDARQELDDALKSLGLRPKQTTIESGQLNQDSDTKIESIRSNPPPAWRELFQEYTKSIGSGEK